MSDAKIYPYINFKNQTEEAMKFYHGIFGGELDIQTFGDSPLESDERNKDLVMHSTLRTGEINIMASDTARAEEVVVGTNVTLSLVGSDEPALTKYFEALGEGGTVVMPLEKQFWGDLFGLVTDKYGIRWMVNIGTGEPPADRNKE